MIVTDLEYHLETKLVEKLDMMIARCTNKRTRKDAVLIVEGSEGEGKTNSSEAIAYYVKHKTGRDINMFFRLQTMLEFAQSTEEKIIIWDEPALDSLSTDWYKETNKDLIRLLMTCRKKRHFFIFNFVKFYKFTEYVVVDRALGLIHMYSRSRNNEPGRFIYIKKKGLEFLFNTFKKKHERAYNKYKCFFGAFPLVEKHIPKMGLIIEGKENATLEDYEKLKDQAIETIGKKDVRKDASLMALRELKNKIGKLKMPIKNRDELAEKLGVSKRSLFTWAKLDSEVENEGEEVKTILTNGVGVGDDVDSPEAEV